MGIELIQQINEGLNTAIAAQKASSAALEKRDVVAGNAYLALGTLSIETAKVLIMQENMRTLYAIRQHLNDIAVGLMPDRQE
jgi:hypothetical protein